MLKVRGTSYPRSVGGLFHKDFSQDSLETLDVESSTQESRDPRMTYLPGARLNAVPSTLKLFSSPGSEYNGVLLDGKSVGTEIGRTRGMIYVYGASIRYSRSRSLFGSPSNRGDGHGDEASRRTPILTVI
ncbi:hypothetical protein J6590_015900 [Homalodisca vitripennis]|nr:hypothetical protein J6590_015900 [Homalodisca vitripennis]